MAEDLRIEPGPACHRGAPVTMRLNGRAVRAFEGETVGAALHAEGERVLMRSIKYHRPRGLFCNTGKCANCLMRIDGTPNARACVTPVHDGIVVETQNSFPSAKHDLLGVIDKVYPRVLDVHDQFARAPLLRPMHHAIVRRMAGYGSIPDATPHAPRRPAIRTLDADVVVVGAGPSGLAAAIAAAEGAARVVLVDEGDRAGGSMLLDPASASRLEGSISRFADAGGTFLARSVALGLYGTDGHGDALPPPGLLAILSPERILECSPRAIVVAAGFHETPALFPGNDLPGILGARAALILLHRHGVLVGKRVVVHGEGAWASRAAEDLARAGAEVTRGAVAQARGRDRVASVTLRSGEVLAVDAVVTATEGTPRVELLQQAGARLVPHGWALAPHVEGATTSIPSVFACGSVLGGDATLDERMRQGARAGEAAAKRARTVSA